MKRRRKFVVFLVLLLAIVALVAVFADGACRDPDPPTHPVPVDGSGPRPLGR